MSNTIHKQHVFVGSNKIIVPAGSKFLQAQKQKDQIAVWYQCDPNAELIESDILIVGTGWNLPELSVGSWQYMNTFQEGEFVWHAFYKG